MFTNSKDAHYHPQHVYLKNAISWSYDKICLCEDVTFKLWFLGDADHAVPPTSDMGPTLSPNTTWSPMTATSASAQPHHHHRNMATPPPASLMNSNHTSAAAGITSFSHQSGFMPQTRPHHHQPFYSWY